MNFTYLRAKSRGEGREGLGPQSIREHTEVVMNTAGRLVEVTGESQLLALGLSPECWLDRLRRDIRLAAFLHDLGKANDHFQGMVWGSRPFPQSIRHEAVSYWIATRPEFRPWLPGLGDTSPLVELVLWAIAGHHRKFPPSKSSDSVPEVCILFSHPGFQSLMLWGGEKFGGGTMPALDDRTIKFTSRENVIGDLEDAHDEADKLVSELPDEEKRYLALLKACLIGADVSGSIGRKGSRTMVEWIGEAFDNLPSGANLDALVARRLEGRSITECAFGGDDRARFQLAVGERTERVVLVSAGCGSGKTLAAYHWAARLADRGRKRRRLFFCYPTMGTATEGYRDYLKDADIDAALVHGRSEIDMEMLGLGDDEPEQDPRKRPGENAPGGSDADSSAMLDLWSTPLVSCTVDTVLGLMQNHRRGVFAWPSIASSAIVFDEVHAYDDDLFAALIRFLKDVRGVPCLLMTASLPDARLASLRSILAGIGESLGEVAGPDHLEKIRRYKRDRSESQWERVGRVIQDGGKVLWVVNTVDAAIDLAKAENARNLGAILYHSRYRYEDRVDRHREVIEAFERPQGTAALAITTQVAEMSLDLSADLLVTQLAPIPSLIQRLGRLNRRAERDDPWPFLVDKPKHPFPYKQAQLDEAEAWLESLGDRGLSQRCLVEAWRSQPTGTPDRRSDFIWLDGGFVTEPRPLREASPGIEIILERDREDVESKRVPPERVRVPMPPPKDRTWLSWPEVAFCKVPPEGCIDYDETRGARWIP